MLSTALPFPKRPRLSEKDFYFGYGRYFITICTFNKEKVFVYPSIVDSAVKYLSRIAAIRAFSVIAYSFMPDHLHLLLSGEKENCDLIKFVSSFKQHSGYNFAKVHKRRLWGTSFYDHVLRNEDSEQAVTRYILENPMRQCLSETIFDYPFSGSLIFTKRELAEFILLA